MTPLTLLDYKNILSFYNIPITSTMKKKKIQELAEDILARKLCRCIKKVKNKNNIKDESKVIGICKDSVLKKKNVHSYSFKCKKKPRFISKKGTKRKLAKIKKRLTRKTIH